MHGKIMLPKYYDTVSFRDNKLPGAFRPSVHSQANKSAFKRLQIPICSYIQHHLRMSKFSVMSCIIVPGAFNFSPEKCTWETASQTRRLKQRLKTALSQSGRLSSWDSSLLLAPGTVEARPRGAGETWANACSAATDPPSDPQRLLWTSSKTNSAQRLEQTAPGVQWTPGAGLRGWLSACPLVCRPQWQRPISELCGAQKESLQRSCHSGKHTHPPPRKPYVKGTFLPYTSSRQQWIEPFSYPSQTALSTSCPPHLVQWALNESKNAPRRPGCQSQLAQRPHGCARRASELTGQIEAGSSRATFAYRPSIG